jgi:hypothetical protein
MIRRIATTLVILLVLGIGGATVLGTGLDLARSRAEAAVYRQRLADLAAEHVAIVDQYNVAVRRTAVTELIVREPADDAPAGAAPSLAVRVRSLSGVEREIATDFDPRTEIYVDFVVKDGRVLIRRLFDENTPPSQGLVIDGSLGTVDWEAENVRLGKAVYRALRSGRWTISVNGSGAIDLAWAGPVDQAPAALAATAEVADFEEVEADVRDAQESIGFGEVWRMLLGRDGPKDAPAGDGD